MSEVTQIDPRTGRRVPASQLSEQQADYTFAETQVGPDGKRRPTNQVERQARRAGRELAQQEPGRTLDRRTPEGLAGTQIDPADGVRRPADDAGTAEGVATAALPEQPPVSDPADVLPVGVTRSTQGTPGMAESATPAPAAVNDRVGGGFRDADGDGQPDEVLEDPRTKEELLDLAREYELEGYSGLNKDELSVLVTDNDPRTVEDLKDEARDTGVPGFSSMRKRELILALAAADKDGGSSGSGDDADGGGSSEAGGPEQPPSTDGPQEPTDGTAGASASPTGSPAEPTAPTETAEGATEPGDGDGNQEPAPSAQPSGTPEGGPSDPGAST